MAGWCFLASLFITIGAYAQSPAPEQDCFNAIPVCNLSYVQPNSYVGSGNVLNEIGPGGCLGAGELNAAWYIITVQAGGDLAFNITPNDLTNDYDWAVFNLTNAACADIATNAAGLQVGCDFSGSTFPNGITGANGGPNSQDEPVIPVLAGETYVLCISNFSNSQSGYTLDFGPSTANIIDNVPPGVIGVTQPIACGSNQLEFSFSESVLCNTVAAADFQLTGPSGNFTITAITGAACALGGTFESTFSLTVSPNLTESGNYVLSLVGPVTDNCGNPAVFPAVFPFVIAAVVPVVTVTDEFCGQNDGQIDINITGGTPPYSIAWDPPLNGQTDSTILNLNDGTYTATISDANGCVAPIQAVVNDPLYFTITTSVVNDLCTALVGSASVQVNGGTGPFNYLWNDPLPAQTTPTATGLGAGIYTVTVTDANNPTCQQVADATVLDFNDVTAGFYANPPEVLYLDPTVTFRNTSTNAISYQWNFGDDSPMETIDNPIHTFPPVPGFYNVSLVVLSPSGCTDTLIIPVRVVYNLNFYVPTAFTPNGDMINEEFKVYSDGINYNDFEIVICDRWGHQVFYTTNPFETWNGALNNEGEILPDGIYVYRCRFTQLYDNIEHKFMGKVALIK